MSYAKSRLGKRHIKKSDLLRELDEVLSAVESDLITTSGDGSIVNTNGDVRVGVLATDAQHGNLGGGTTHAVATPVVAGFMSSADKVLLGSTQTTLTNIVSETKEPTGFPNRTDSLVTFDNSTRTLTIAPVGASYEIFYQGTSITKTSPESYSWPDIEGLRLIYFDASGVLTSTQNPDTITSVFSGEGVAVAAIYWDAVNNVTLRRIEERHSTSLSGSTHSYLHRYFGTAYESGGALSGFSIVAGSPSTAAATQFAVDNTVVADEDIRVAISTGLPQTLTPVAQIPIFYLTGTGVWRKKSADAYPLLYSGTAGYVGASGRLPWNQLSGGNWSLAEVGNNNFVLMHYFATTDLVEPIIGVVGQNTYTSIALARAGATTEINTILGLASLLSTEKRALGTVIYQSASVYTNAPKAKVVVTDTGANYIDWRATTFTSGLIGTGVQAVTSALITEAYSSAWAVPDWYLDNVTGSDSNSGVLVNAPLKTGAELTKRLGPAPLWGQSVTIHVGSNGLTDDLVITGNLLLPNTHLDIQGTTTQLASAGLITTVTTQDHATPRGPTLICSGIADWTPYVGQRVRVTAGTKVNSVTWILAANAHGLGLNVALTGVWAQKRDVSPDPASMYDCPAIPTVGDTVVIESLPFIPHVEVRLSGAVNTSGTDNAWPSRQYLIENVSSTGIIRNCSSDPTPYRNLIFGCKSSFVNSENYGSAASQGYQDIVAHHLEGSTLGPLRASGVWVGLCVRPTSVLVNSDAAPGFLVRVVSYGTALCPVGSDTWSNVQVFGVPNASSQAIALTKGRYTDVSAAENNGYGLGLASGANFYASSTFNIRGTVANVRLTSDPVYNFPLTVLSSTFRPTADFEQRGTATLVGGTVAVAIPWADWTRQTVLLQRRQALGTLGNLEAPVGSRTSTGFTIQSDNALDSSIVDWVITPLGRNIFIAG